MKKIYLLLVFSFAFLVSAQAQSRTNKIHKLPHHFKLPAKGTDARPMVACDVLNLNQADLADYNIYVIDNNIGFVVGTNLYGDLEEAASFEAPSNALYLTQILIGFGFANSNIPANLSKIVNIKVYGADDDGAPDEVLATVPVTLGDLKQDVDDSLFTTISFPTPLTLPANKKFVVSVDISELLWDYPANQMDSLGIFSLDVTAAQENFYIKTSDGFWVKGSTLWDDLIQSLMIFPSVSNDPNCLESTPVRLSSFNAQKKDGYNEINWSTASEQNNSGFELDRSGDGNNFSALATIPSKATSGNSNKTLHYFYKDQHPINGNNYYRLAQKDKDGRTTYSQVVSLNNADPNAKILDVYPNPVTNTLHVGLSSPSSKQVTISVLDFSGRKIISEIKQIIPGENRLSLNVQQLQSGNYLLKISTPGEESNIIKFVKY